MFLTIEDKESIWIRRIQLTWVKMNQIVAPIISSIMSTWMAKYERQAKPQFPSAHFILTLKNLLWCSHICFLDACFFECLNLHLHLHLHFSASVFSLSASFFCPAQLLYLISLSIAWDSLIILSRSSPSCLSSVSFCDDLFAINKISIEQDKVRVGVWLLGWNSMNETYTANRWKESHFILVADLFFYKRSKLKFCFVFKFLHSPVSYRLYPWWCCWWRTGGRVPSGMC